MGQPFLPAAAEVLSGDFLLLWQVFSIDCAA
jgi:hypothetical protein